MSEARKQISFIGFREIANEASLFDKPRKRKKSKLNKVVKKVLLKIEKATEGTSVVSFIVLLLRYISIRAKVVLLFISVFFEIISGIFVSIKDNVVSKLFWGRSKHFKYLIHGISLFFIAFIFLFSSYRDRIVEFVQMGSSAAYAGEYKSMTDQNYYSDVLIQNTTTITDVPQERGRYGIIEYEVKSGDSFFKIGQFFGISEKTIRETNGLSAAHVLRPGQMLKIPPADGIIIKVAKGDTLESVAKKYKGSSQTIEEVMQSMADVNWLDAPFTLKEGEELFVPGGELPKPAAPKRSTYASAGSTPRTYSSGGDSSVGRFLGWPVAGGAGRVTQCYKTYHNGIDIADGSMPDLVAAADGTVVFAGCHSGRCPAPGQMTGGSGAAWGVEVDHGNGYTTVYVHMFQIYVKAGDKVTKGQAIGQMGKTGTATGIHVHFMLWKGGKYKTINPAPFMERSICGS